MSVLFGIFRWIQGRQPARQVRAAVKYVRHDHLVRHLDQHDEMLARPRETQILRQIGIVQAAAFLRGRFARGDGSAAGDEVGLTGLGLARPKSLQRPARDLDERPFRLPRQPPRLRYQDAARAAAKALRITS